MLSRNGCRSCRKQLGIAPVTKAIRRQSKLSSFDHLRSELPARSKVVIYDDICPTNTHRLNVSLSSFVPKGWIPESSLRKVPESDHSKCLPPAHHLVYFNPAYPEDELLSDGTDPNQSPGYPFVRRMWAGGYVRYNPESGIKVDNSRHACVEGIRDVTIKGKSGEEKVFVGIERRFAPVLQGETDNAVRSRLWEEKESEFGESRIIERRNIVFMYDKTPEELEAMRRQGSAPGPTKILKRMSPLTCSKRRIANSPTAQHPPTFSHTLVPTPALLFRYSALTFNAHAIHLDPLYCKEVEGHRNLLFHGPLSFTLLVTLLQNHISKRKGAVIESIEYRNLAPLYCSEPIKFCGRQAGENKYDIWAETPEGGIAVKGNAKVIVSEK